MRTKRSQIMTKLPGFSSEEVHSDGDGVRFFCVGQEYVYLSRQFLTQRHQRRKDLETWRLCDLSEVTVTFFR